jgi:hypothetical protein
VLAPSTCLLLAGCGGGTTAAGAAGAGTTGTVCTAFEKAYEGFQSGDTPPLVPGNTWDELINSAGQAIGPSLPSGGVSQDIFNLMNNATDASEDLTYHQPLTKDLAQFNSNLKKVGKDCSFTFTPATASSKPTTG